MAEQDPCLNTGTPQQPAGGPEDENLNDENSEGFDGSNPLEPEPESTPTSYTPLLESDVSLTPHGLIDASYLSNSYSVGKSTWFFSDSCLLGTEEFIYTSEESRVLTQNMEGGEVILDVENYKVGKFLSKPPEFRAIVDRKHIARDLANGTGLASSKPCAGMAYGSLDMADPNPNILGDEYPITEEEIVDPLRWISDMYWVNLSHRDGSADYANKEQFKIINFSGDLRPPPGVNFSRAKSLPDLLYLNSAGKLKIDGGIVSHLVNSCGSRTLANRPQNPSSWLQTEIQNNCAAIKDPDEVNAYVHQPGKFIGVVYYNKKMNIVRNSPSTEQSSHYNTRHAILLREIYADGQNGWKRITPVNTWRNIDLPSQNGARQVMQRRRQSLGQGAGFFKETYNVYEVFQPRQNMGARDYPVSWNWFDYFYGNVNMDILEGLVELGLVENPQQLSNDPDERRLDLLRTLKRKMLVSDRENQFDQDGVLRVNEKNDFNWSRIYQLNTELTEGYCVNPFPIISYWGESKVEEELPMRQIRSGQFGAAIFVETTYSTLPPTNGQKIFVDLTTKVSEILTKDEADVLDLENKTYFDIRPVYSYYDCIFEKIISLGIQEYEMFSPYRGDLNLVIKSGGLREEGLSAPAREDYDDLMTARILEADNFFGLNFLEKYGLDRPGMVPLNPYDTEELLGDITEQMLDPDQALDLQKVRMFAMSLSHLYGFDIIHAPDTAPPEYFRDRQNIFLSLFSHEQLEDIYSQRYINSSFVEIELGNIEKSLLAESLIVNGDDTTLIKDLFFALESRLGPRETGRPDPFATQPGSEITEFANVGQEDITISSEDPYGLNTAAYNNVFNRRTDYSYVEQLVESALLGDEDDRDAAVLETKVKFSDTINTPTAELDFEDWWAGVYERVVSNDRSTPIERFANVFRMLAIQSNVRKYVEGHARTYNQIVNGDPARSEVLGYVIKKFRIDPRNDTKTFVSNFIIMSNNDHDYKRFVDSQVKYGRIYQYEIHRIVAVVGNHYAYVDNMSRDQHDHNLTQNYDRGASFFRTPGDFTRDESKKYQFRMQFGLINRPTLKLYLLPSERKRVSVVDRPPMFPDVDIIPFKNNQTNIMFNLSAQGGETSAPPVILEEDDIEQFFLSGLNQGLLDNEYMKARFAFGAARDFISAVEDVYRLDGAETALEESHIKSIEFKSDDPVKKFEIFRIEDIHPSSIYDFKDRKIAVLETGAENASFIDTIEPDRKYYYIFRCEDIHNHVSNPTNIFEVELCSYGTAVHPKIRIVDLSKKIRKQKDDMRHFIEIKPTMQNQQIDLPPSGQSDDLLSRNFVDFYKQKQNNVWNKRYKLRIYSKKTGKELDINFRFNPVVKNEENKKVNLIC